MQTIADFMGDDHDACDEIYAHAEMAVAAGDWDRAQADCGRFIQAMQRHFGMEEEALFPAFEQAMGNAMGPTQVMRHEHTQMRQLFDQMHQALAARDAEEWLGAGETLLILMQQHNAKEEQILYPMCDRTLQPDLPSLLAQMEAVGNPP